MNRSLLKLVLVLLVVGALPFAASMLLIDDLLSRAVSLGLNQEVQEHLERSADAHRQFIEAEKQAHALAADVVASDPRWTALLADDLDVSAVREALLTFIEIHPRLVEISFQTERLSEPIVVTSPNGASREDSTPRDETREIEQLDPRAEVMLVFRIPTSYIDELEQVGDTLDTFRALEAVQGELTSDMRRAYLYLAGGVALLALILGTLLARRTTSRLGRIAAAANRVAAGDLEVRVRDRAHDELGDLARQFNNMVEEIRASHERVAYLQRVSAWQEIARRLAHEIKNPLTPILLAVQQLDETFDALKNDSARFRLVLDDAVEIVQEEVETLRGLVREFSDFARLPKVDAQPERLARFLDDFLRTNPQLHSRAEVELAVDDDCKAHMAAIDNSMMRRALVNLIENAIDAVEEHGREKPVIELVLRQDGDRFLLTIADNGPGIAEGNLDRLFEPYFTTKAHGTGLGLPIVKKIILDHGGWIQLENLPSRGCRVAVSLPMVTATTGG